MLEPAIAVLPNDHINSDCQLRSASFVAGYGGMLALIGGLLSRNHPIFFIKSATQKHRIAVTKKSIRLVDSVLIGVHN